MQTSRLQLGLITTLSIALGLSLASPDAIGYPTTAISLGTNPLFAEGGQLTGSTSTTVLTADEHTAVVSDLVLSIADNSYTCAANMHVNLSIDGRSVGQFEIGLSRPAGNFSQYAPVVQIDLQSGIPVPPGEHLDMSVSQISQYDCTDSVTELSYMMSGYFAQP